MNSYLSLLPIRKRAGSTLKSYNILTASLLMNEIPVVVHIPRFLGLKYIDLNTLNIIHKTLTCGTFSHGIIPRIKSYSLASDYIGKTSWRKEVSGSDHKRIISWGWSLKLVSLPTAKRDGDQVRWHRKDPLTTTTSVGLAKIIMLAFLLNLTILFIK